VIRATPAARGLHGSRPWPRRIGRSAVALFAVLAAATPAAAAQLTLTWVDASGGQAGVRIERKTGAGGTYAEIAQQSPGVASYVDTTVTAGTTYCYRVRAFNTAGTSDYSNEACGSPATGFALSIARSGTGAGTVTSTPAGIDCGVDCAESYAAGTVVTLAAAPASGSTFTGWSAAGCTGTGPCTVTGNAPLSVTATFTAATSGGGGTPSVQPIPSLAPGAAFTITVNGMTTGVGASITNAGATSFWPPWNGIDDRPRNWNYKLAPTANPETLALQAPTTPGTYEIHVFDPRDDSAVPGATRSFTVASSSGSGGTPPSSPTVTVPGSVAPGAAFTISISGMPDGVGASITAVGAASFWPPYNGIDARPSNWNYKLSPTANPETLSLQAPPTAGSYEIHIWHPVDDVPIPSATTPLRVGTTAP
jgi:List-Bact-rpt repeat protein